MKHNFSKLFGFNEEAAFFARKGRGRGGNPRGFGQDDQEDGHHEHRHHHGHRRHGPGPHDHPGRGFGRHFFGDGPFGFRARGARARKGDIRAGILALLSEEPRNGYQIMQTLAERSGGVWRASPGAVYPALQQLQDEGLISSEAEGASKVFSLTEDGKKYCETHAEDIAAPWDKMANESDRGAEDLFVQLKSLAAAVGQIAETATPEQAKQTEKILGDARRAIYRMLAEEEA